MYKKNYTSFDEYIEKRWDKKKSWGYDRANAYREKIKFSGILENQEFLIEKLGRNLELADVPNAVSSLLLFRRFDSEAKVFILIKAILYNIKRGENGRVIESDIRAVLATKKKLSDSNNDTELKEAAKKRMKQCYRKVKRSYDALINNLRDFKKIGLSEYKTEIRNMISELNSVLADGEAKA